MAEGGRRGLVIGHLMRLTRRIGPCLEHLARSGREEGRIYEILEEGGVRPLQRGHPEPGRSGRRARGLFHVDGEGDIAAGGGGRRAVDGYKP